MHYDSFNYILTAFLNILPGDLRALPLEKKTTKTNPTKIMFELFFFRLSGHSYLCVALYFM